MNKKITVDDFRNAIKSVSCKLVMINLNEIPDEDLLKLDLGNDLVGHIDVKNVVGGLKQKQHLDMPIDICYVVPNSTLGALYETINRYLYEADNI
ncbi:MAG: hypothetical protein IJ218_07135 [Alphaproteobacteria bacterium]|nr:hypothetical protein [Alphaproteobacteria bacterium]